MASEEMPGLAAVGDPGLRATLAFVRAQAAGVSADDLAARLDVHRNVARARLERLVEAGLLVAAYERRTGRTGPGAGRPAKLYRPTPDLTAIEFPERRYAALLELLIEELPAKDRAARLRRSGAAFAQVLRADPGSGTRSFRDAVAELVATLATLGYGATVETLADDEAVLSTPTCPLRPLVVAAPEAAQIDCGMWAELLAGALEPELAARVSCETSDCLDHGSSCRIRLRLAGG